MGTYNRAERRHHRVRLIRKRMRIVREVWQTSDWPDHPGRLAKFNLKCSCRMCSNREWTRPLNRRERREERERLHKIRKLLTNLAGFGSFS